MNDELKIDYVHYADFVAVQVENARLRMALEKALYCLHIEHSIVDAKVHIEQALIAHMEGKR